MQDAELSAAHLWCRSPASSSLVATFFWESRIFRTWKDKTKFSTWFYLNKLFSAGNVCLSTSFLDAFGLENERWILTRFSEFYFWLNLCRGWLRASLTQVFAKTLRTMTKRGGRKRSEGERKRSGGKGTEKQVVEFNCSWMVCASVAL